MQTELPFEVEPCRTVATLPAEERQYVSQGYVAHLLNVSSDVVVNLINSGYLDADTDVRGDVLLFKVSDVMACKARMRGEQ